MQVLQIKMDEARHVVGWAARVLVLTATPGGEVVRRLGALAGQVDTAAELYTALAAVIDDPQGCDLLVLDCDDFGGLDFGHRAVAMIRAELPRLPVMLVSRETATQQFPEDRAGVTVLRAPLSAVSARVGFGHALRDRLAWMAA